MSRDSKMAAFFASKASQIAKGFVDKRKNKGNGV